ncbi:MAG: 3-dehydroquinate synthase, partial [Clostridia bacterium]|nr:3-dehydroquinate synthase [Clostridia bacterium]
AEVVTASLSEAGFSVVRRVIPHGEASKSAAHLMELLEAVADEHLTRSDLLVALGGGVVGDLGGFCAAVYQRGIDFIQIPTTLLAMVDASVGGKTAIDLKAGKNLCGAFHQPALVVCDTDCLATLPPEILADGMAEVIKYAFINDRVLYEHLTASEQACDDPLAHTIRLCIEDKRALVEADETDKGARQLLNLGHTVGHAVEACSRFEISHGSAVAIGMTIMARAAEKAGVAKAGTTAALVSLLEANGLPTTCPFTAEDLYASALSDKKRDGGDITLVVPYGVADARLVRVPVDALEGYIRTGLED